MSLAVLVSSASVMHKAIRIADDLGKVTTDPISISIVAFVAIALVVIQMVIGVYHFCHFRFSKVKHQILALFSGSVTHFMMMGSYFLARTNNLHQLGYRLFGTDDYGLRHLRS